MFNRLFVADIQQQKDATRRELPAGQRRSSTAFRGGGYHSTMQLATGTVLAGKLVVEGLDLPDGETVVVLTREVEDEVHLSPEDEADLLESIAEADRGETITAEELFARLDRLR